LVPLNLVLLRQPHPRDVCHEQRPESPRKLEVIRCAEWPPAQLCKAELCNVAGAAGHGKVATPYTNRLAFLDGDTLGECSELCVDGSSRSTVQRRKVGMREGAGYAAII